MDITLENLPSTIPLKTAAQISGRSIKTIRRWIKEGKVEDKRPSGSGRCTPIKVDTVQLRAYLSTMEVNQKPTARKTIHKTPRSVPTVKPNGEVIALREQIEMMDRYNNEVKVERDRLLVKLESQETKLEALRKLRLSFEEFRTTATIKIEKLKNENRTLKEERTRAKYGVRGLLKGAIRKLKR